MIKTVDIFALSFYLFSIPPRQLEGLRRRTAGRQGV